MPDLDDVVERPRASLFGPAVFGGYGTDPNNVVLLNAEEDSPLHDRAVLVAYAREQFQARDAWRARQASERVRARRATNSRALGAARPAPRARASRQVRSRPEALTASGTRGSPRPSDEESEPPLAPPFRALTFEERLGLRRLIDRARRLRVTLPDADALIVCSKCGEEKPPTAYSGRRKWCKACEAKRVAGIRARKLSIA
jgi:hypothetical protein